MSKEQRIAFRVDDDEKAMAAAICRKLGRKESDAMRLMLREFAKALGVSTGDSGKAIIRVQTETIGELPY